MQAAPNGYRRRLLAGLSLLAALVLALAACSGNGSNSGGATLTQTTPKNSGSGGATTIASATPGILLGPQPCPNAVKDPSHWDQIIPTQPNVSKVESVTCGYLTGTPTLQGLITVRYYGTGAVLDVYVYTNIESPGPTQLFKLLNLYKGDARISLRNTVMTAEVDQSSSLNKGKSDAGYTQDLFREFNTASFAPIAFPGMYPDLTRFQAERDQAQVNAGQEPWKLSAAMVAMNFATDPALLGWPANVTATIVSGGGSSDAEAVVNMKNPAAVGGTITLTMQRLEGNTNGGIWEIVGVTSKGLAISTPKSLDNLSSPAAVTGTGSAFEGIIGRLIVLDHTYANIGQAAVTGVSGNGSTTFSVNVPFNSTFKTGVEDGIVALYAENNAGGPPSAAVMVKELI